MSIFCLLGTFTILLYSSYKITLSRFPIRTSKGKDKKVVLRTVFAQNNLSAKFFRAERSTAVFYLSLSMYAYMHSQLASWQTTNPKFAKVAPTTPLDFELM